MDNVCDDVDVYQIDRINGLLVLNDIPLHNTIPLSYRKL